ncbi:hypothetical protein DXG01_001940 [Tephrocybe rancida]|nr:hypothetical protein DXG01_001940 [Tephrocybe rancida]
MVHNAKYQQRINSAIGHLLAIVDALPNGASALTEIRDLTSCVSDFEESSDIGFKHLKEHISKHHERCDHTSARVTDLEEHIQKLEHRDLEERSWSMCLPTPVAGPSQQGRTFVSLSPSYSSVKRSDKDEEEVEVPGGEDEAKGREEVQAIEEDAEGDTGMGDFSDDSPLLSPQDEPEGEMPAEIGGDMEVECEVEDNTLRESTDVPAMGTTAKQSADLGASLPEATGTDESPAPPKVTQDNEADRTSILIAAEMDVEKSGTAPPIIATDPGIEKSGTATAMSLGGGPIIPGVSRANLPTTMGDGHTVPAIQLINPMPDNSQDQLTPPGPTVQRTSPCLHSDGSGRELQSRTPAPLSNGRQAQG